MSQGYQIYDQNKLHHLTFQIVQWVDVFTRNEYKQIIVNSFDFCRKNKGLELYAYVIMTKHIHLIARAKETFHTSPQCLLALPCALKGHCGFIYMIALDQYLSTP